MAKAKDVVISRDDTHGREGRVYVVHLGGRMWGQVEQAEVATRFSRKDAKALLDRGRWHGLKPKLEPVS